MRVITQGGVYVGSISHDAAVAGRRCGRYQVKAASRTPNGRLLRYLCVVDADAGVSHTIPPSLSTTYMDQLADVYKARTLKRVIVRQTIDGEPIKTFERYDNDLTFKELRSGQIESAVTRLKRASQRAFRVS